MADLHWQILSRSQPHARRLSGIDGIRAAHRECARLSRTSNFFVVDADNEILDIDFGLQLPDYDKQYVHVWRARNPVNDLLYGWGGVKLFPKKLLLAEAEMPLDMTTAFPLKIIPTVGSVTHFNTSPYATWRSAFRECVKLACNQSEESRERLDVWCSLARGPFAEDCLRGARAGRDYGATYREQRAMLLRINDWAWLSEQYAISGETA